jgi:hypothetical protein
MPFIKLQFKPGVNRDQTDYSNEGGWYECDKIRFRSGYPQKIGGWTKAAPTAFIGVCRQMWNWITTYSDNFLALGTNERVYIEAGGNYYDITPFNTALSGSNTFATANGTKVVTVTTGTAIPEYISTGELVKIAGFTVPIGDIPIDELNGVHEVTVTGPTTFTFTTTTTATSTAPTSVSGDGYTVQFEISPGNPIAVGGYGWGVGPWGGYVPATPTAPPPSAWGVGTKGKPLLLPQRDWWFDNFDNDLVMNIRNGAGYWWERGTLADPSTNLAKHAITLKEYATSQTKDPAAVPDQIMQLLVSQQDKHLIALGASPYLSTDFDPLLIRWASQDSPGDWTPSDF